MILKFRQNSIFKNTGNFISQFFDETKFSALAPNSIQEHQGETCNQIKFYFINFIWTSIIYLKLISFLAIY